MAGGADCLFPAACDWAGSEADLAWLEAFAFAGVADESSSLNENGCGQPAIVASL
jgi:hypothetical protein